MQEQAMGVLGHELRNPLSAIAALARGTMRREDLPNDVRERLQQVDRAAQRALAMIHSVLDFSASRRHGTLDVRPVRADPSTIASNVIEELRVAYPGRVIDLAVLSSGPFVLDPIRIAQVLSNLISNALVHGFAHTPVQVTLDVGDAEALIAVHNRGPHIPPERVARLFEPFTQGSAARRDGQAGQDRQETDVEHRRGVGLGLYIVEAIVRAHGGTVAMESCPDSGTTFSVRLPVRPSPHNS
jgi:signal transduction histidine kinase